MGVVFLSCCTHGVCKKYIVVDFGVVYLNCCKLESCTKRCAQKGLYQRGVLYMGSLRVELILAQYVNAAPPARGVYLKQALTSFCSLCPAIEV